MVCAAFNLVDGTISTCASPGGDWKKITECARLKSSTRMFAFQNAPVVARVVNGNKRSIPPIPPHMELDQLLGSRAYRRSAGSRVSSDDGR